MLPHRPWFAWAALAALSAGFAVEVHAQAGVEAAAQAAHAVRWIERGQRMGESASDRFRLVAPTRSSSVRPGTATRTRRAAPAGPPRVPRKPSPEAESIAGRVVEKTSRVPVAGAVVVLYSTEPEYIIESYSMRTDSAGAYRFDQVEPGRWAVALDTLPVTYAAPRLELGLTVARGATLQLPDFELSRTACVAGEAKWADGMAAADLPVTIAPRDTTLFGAAGGVDGHGEFQVCAPADSAMVWIDLRDGRRLGRSARLAEGEVVRLEFRPEPFERMQVTPLRLRAELADGSAVRLAQFVAVGRRPEADGRPALVYSREQSADHAGDALFYLPPGDYEILAMNPREGQWGRVQELEVRATGSEVVDRTIRLSGASTAAQRDAWRAELLDRAEVYLFVWAR